MEVLIPGLKRILWTKMRNDLAQYVPNAPPDLLLCPACARWLLYDKFNVEHVIPKQVLADDTSDIKTRLVTNQRGIVTLTGGLSCCRFCGHAA